MDRSRALDAYIQALSSEWHTAVLRFLDTQRPSPVPVEHPRRKMLHDARQQLQCGAMIADDVIMDYLRVLHGLDKHMEARAIYMDTHAPTKILQTDGKYQTRKLHALKHISGSELTGNIFWIIHHQACPHWSLVHINIAQKAVVAYDTFPSLNGSFTTTAADTLFSYWKNNYLKDTSGWSVQKSNWKDYDCIQAKRSNDCGILCILLIRKLQGNGCLPKLPEEEKEREGLMEKVGERMRLRIAAELIADLPNPQNGQIPDWLKSSL